MALSKRIKIAGTVAASVLMTGLVGANAFAATTAQTDNTVVFQLSLNPGIHSILVNGTCTNINVPGDVHSITVNPGEYIPVLSVLRGSTITLEVYSTGSCTLPKGDLSSWSPTAPLTGEWKFSV